jgi:hypothetical protein
MPIVLSPRQTVEANSTGASSGLVKLPSRQAVATPVAQEGTAAGRLLIKLLDQTANRGQRVRKIYEFVDQGLADDGLDADTIAKAVKGLAPGQRKDMVLFLSMFLEEINGRQLIELAGDGEERADLISQLADFLPFGSLEAKELQQLTEGLSGFSLETTLAGLAPYVRGAASPRGAAPASK